MTELPLNDLTLVIGNKNYSSWSLRPWLALRVAGIPFRELRIPLYRPGAKAEILKHSPSGKVPALKVGGELVIVDSLAIGEFLAEQFPQKRLWPEDVRARAQARAVCAEMHSGFAALRQHMPMDTRARRPGQGMNEAVAKDIERILALWSECRERYGAGDPFLFGAFSLADAFYAPVATRFLSYGVALPPEAQAYVDAVLALPAMQDWLHAGAKESEVIDWD